MIHFIVGTEAELIKTFPLMIRLKEAGYEYNFIATGQHDLTRSELLKMFGLKKPNNVLYQGEKFTSFRDLFLWFVRIFLRFSLRPGKVFNYDKAGLVIVHGDTASTLLGAFMAKFYSIKLAHLEAGLRSGNLLSPFPEEMVRRLVDYLSDICFCPGVWACENLKGKKVVNIKQNTLIDSYEYIKKYLVKKNLDKDYMLLVFHRTENLSNARRVRHLIKKVIDFSKSMKVIFVLHHTTRHILERLNLYSSLVRKENIILLPRQSYLNFVSLLCGASLVVTDGGSNQEECFYLGVPTLLLRENTERREGLGRNVFLSEWKKDKIDFFLKSYAKFQFPPFKYKGSPSDVVFNYVKRNL